MARRTRPAGKRNTGHVATASYFSDPAVKAHVQRIMQRIGDEAAAAGLSARRLCQLANIHRTTYNRAVIGERDPGIGEVFSLTRAIMAAADHDPAGLDPGRPRREAEAIRTLLLAGLGLAVSDEAHDIGQIARAYGAPKPGQDDPDGEAGG
jgi:hypothetical protein